MTFRLVLSTALMALVAAGCSGHIPFMPGVNRVGQMTGLKPTDEEQIVMALNDVQKGMENRQVFKVLAHVSRNYYDEMGRDYAGIQAYLADVFKKYKEIKVTRVVPRVMVYGLTARAVETFGTVAEPQDAALQPPIHLQGQVVVNLEKVNGDWQIVEWGQML